MAWTTPGTAVAGDVLTAAFWNSNVRDNETFLFTPPMCIVRRNAAQAIADNTNTSISFDTEDLDTDSMFTPTSTDVTIKTAGIYMLSGVAALQTAATTVIASRMRVNGNVVADNFLTGSAYASNANVTTIKKLAVNDVVTFQIYQSGPATSKNTGSTTQLAVIWVGFG
jgi:hypothetical protein